MGTLLLAVFSASLVGSLHCAGMCGGFVAFYSGAATGGKPLSKAQRWSAHAAYSFGRLSAYTSLGLIAGTLGATLNIAGQFSGSQRAAAVLAGTLIVGWGLLSLAGKRRSVFEKWVPASLRQALAKVYRLLAAAPPSLRAFSIGSLSSLLPCGWLYAFAISAAGTGSAVAGATLMIAFWLGTLPMMLGAGWGLGLLSQKLRHYVPTLTALSLIGIGLFTVFGRLEHIGIQERYSEALAPNSSNQSILEQVESLNSAELPCCDSEVSASSEKKR